MKAGIYVRMSLDMAGKALGIARQLEDCTAHADTLGWPVVEIYTDNEISAVSNRVRPAYRRMLADMDAGIIDAIIVWHADRLYRKVTDLGELIDTCKRSNVQISTVKGGNIDLTTPTGRLVAGLLAQVATYEGEAKADRWKRSWRQGREAGDFARTGTRLFGYTRAGQLIPKEAAVARSAVDEVLTGGTILGICRDLEVAGIKTTRGTTWRQGAMRQYLRNPRIAALSTLNGEVVAEGNWEPLIDRETWETLRVLLDGRTRAYVPRVSLLNGLVYCGVCGARLITGSTGRRTGRSYRCPSRPGMPGKGCVNGQAKGIEEIVEAYARTRLGDPRIRKRIATLRAEPSGAHRELGGLELRIRELEAQLDEPGTPVKTILRAIDRTKERQEAILATLGGPARTPLPMGDDWPTDLHRRRALVDLVVGKVVLMPSPGGNRFQPERVHIEPR